MLDEATYNLIIDLCIKATKESNWEVSLEINEEIRHILLDYIKNDPADIEVRLKLIKHVYSTNPGDILDIIDYINELLQYDSNNIYALLFLTYIQRFDLADMDEKLIERLKEYKSDDDEIMAMIAIGISWYYDLMYLLTKEIECLEEQEMWLKKSLYYCSSIVRNYWELIVFYLELGKNELAKPLIPLALNNIKHVFKERDLEDPYLLDTTDVEEFFNIRYKEIHISQSCVDDLLSWQNIE